MAMGQRFAPVRQHEIRIDLLGLPELLGRVLVLEAVEQEYSLAKGLLSLRRTGVREIDLAEPFDLGGGEGVKGRENEDRGQGGFHARTIPRGKLATGIAVHGSAAGGHGTAEQGATLQERPVLPHRRPEGPMRSGRCRCPPAPSGRLARRLTTRQLV